MKLYTAEEYAKKLGGARVLVTIAAVEKETIDGEPAVVVYYTEVDGEDFGVIMDRHLAEEMTAQLGPHFLVDEFFRLH